MAGSLSDSGISIQENQWKILFVIGGISLYTKGAALVLRTERILQMTQTAVSHFPLEFVALLLRLPCYTENENG